MQQTGGSQFLIQKQFPLKRNWTCLHGNCEYMYKAKATEFLKCEGCFWETPVCSFMQQTGGSQFLILKQFHLKRNWTRLHGTCEYMYEAKATEFLRCEGCFWGNPCHWFIEGLLGILKWWREVILVTQSRMFPSFKVAFSGM